MNPSIPQSLPAFSSAAASSSSSRGALLWLAAIAWFAATAWVRPLAMPDEGRYLSVAWEMLGSGNWLVPTLDGLPFFHKPPLFYWLADAAMSVGGPSAFAGRMPSIVAAGSLVWAFHRFDLRWNGAKHAMLLLVVLATAPYMYFAAQYANMDMLVAACISVTVLCASHAALQMMEGRSPGPALPAAYAMAAFGVLAKGLIGCVLPAAIILVWLVAAGRGKLVLRLFSLPGVVLFFAIALPWLVAMQARFPQFFDYFILEQHVHRFAGSGFNNAQPWWFYLPVLFALMMPWSFAIAGAWRRSATDRSASAAAVRLLMICWAAVVIVFFSIPQSKLIGYALPAVPPLAWLAADAVASARAESFVQRHTWTIAGGACVLLLVSVMSYAARAPHSSREVSKVLAGLRAEGEPVVFFDTYPYDIVFDAQLRPPIAVVQAWRDPALARRDSWPKELLDARRFTADAAADRLLETVPDLPAAARGWIVSPAGANLPAALDAYAVVRTRELTLWKLRTDPAEGLAASR